MRVKVPMVVVNPSLKRRVTVVLHHSCWLPAPGQDEVRACPLIVMFALLRMFVFEELTDEE